MNSDWMIVLITLIFSAFFSGMEIAFVSANKLRIELDNKNGEFSSRLLSSFLKSPSRFIATMLVGNNIALVLYGLTTAKIMRPFLASITESEALILFLQTILSTLIVLVSAEFLPKSLGNLYPNKILKIFAIPLWLIFNLLLPLVFVFTSISNVMLRLFMGIKVSEEEPVFGRIDLKNYLEAHTSSQDFTDELDPEIQILQNALDFSSLKARECMIPRKEIVALEINEDIQKLQDQFIETGFSKILIYRDSIDNIIGFTHSFEMFKKPEDIKSILLPISVIPESMPANKILDLFTKERKSISVVIDEFGGTAGIITLEDIMEEIFGEIEDEHDNSDLEIRQINDSSFELSGRHEIDYLNEKLKLNLPISENYETLSGLIIHFHESIPTQGEWIDIPQFSFEITEVNDTHIDKVVLKRLEEN